MSPIAVPAPVILAEDEGVQRTALTWSGLDQVVVHSKE